MIYTYMHANMYLAAPSFRPPTAAGGPAASSAPAAPLPSPAAAAPPSREAALPSIYKCVHINTHKHASVEARNFSTCAASIRQHTSAYVGIRRRACR